MAVTGRWVLAVLAGTLVVGVSARSGLALLIVNAVLVLLAVLDALLAAPVRPVGLHRSGDTRVRLGEQARVSIHLANPGRRRLRGVLRDAWVPSAGAHNTRHHLDVAAGGRTRLTTVLTPTRRGDRAADRITIRSRGPLGLAARQGAHTVPWTLRALPAFESRRHLPSRLARLRELDGRSAIRVRGQGTEFDSLREYVIGDDVRAIDWRASARAVDVMVRTWRPERDRRVVIVLDTGRTAAARIGDGTRLDTSLDAALLLAALASHAGDRVDLLAYDRRLRAEVTRASPTQVLPAFVEALAGVEPELLETDGRGLVAAVLTRVRQRALVVLLTSLDAAALEEGLLTHLPLLTARHRVILAAVADPRLAELRAGRADVAQVYAAGAAAAAQLSREGMAARLRRAGVEVVDADPATLAPRLADTYLALKAAGRL